eukprot:GHVU01003691.1.p1 GENE.GHVU01003691.1~~GHVU01003691.1.p1  ORF type:complete len:230 (+),score=33.78 GHVU01003691.1:112-801(+)
MHPGGASDQWEKFRGQFARIQSQIEMDVADLSKQSKDKHGGGGGSSYPKREGEADTGEDLSATHKRITKNIAQAEELWSKLRSLANDPTRNRQVLRLREILDGLAKELKRLAAEREEGLRRAALLGLGREDESSSDAQSWTLRERTALETSITMIDDMVASGRSTTANLKAQRTVLGGTGSKLKTMASEIPGVDKVIGKIRNAKMREQVIVVSVTGFMLICMAWYFLRR